VPLDRWHEALRGGLDAAGAMTDTVHLSFGDVPGSEYAMQLFADHLVHGWDLAVALGRPAALDPDDAAAALAWFAEREDAYRAAGMIGPRVPAPADADAGTRLLAAFGRTASDPVTVVERFNAAFNRHDVAAVMALMSEDCVFEGTVPPDGRRYEGSAAVREAWDEFFAASPDAWFDTEETIAAGDRVVVRWRYRWGPGGSGGHVRGVDVFRIAGGLVTEKLAYVKG
jgi:ketosteroid isomerase-like protein